MLYFEILLDAVCVEFPIWWSDLKIDPTCIFRVNRSRYKVKQHLDPTDVSIYSFAFKLFCSRSRQMLEEMRGGGRIRRRRMFYCNYGSLWSNGSYFGAEDCVEVEIQVAWARREKFVWIAGKWWMEFHPRLWCMNFDFCCCCCCLFCRLPLPR